MQELMKPINYVVEEVRDLPVSWISSHGVDINVAGAYERSCKRSGESQNSDRIAELLGNNVVHLRQHTLENGLRYVTIHQKDGTEIFDDNKYTGLITCGCGAIHDSPAVTSAIWALEEKPDLRDGFKLLGTRVTHAEGNSQQYEAIESIVDKDYVVDGKKVKIHYSLRPDFAGDGGQLHFEFDVNTLDTVTYQVKNNSEGSRIEDRNKDITSKHVKINILSLNKEEQRKSNMIGKSSILVIYNLPNRGFQGTIVQIEFKFDNYSRLEEVVGVSHGRITHSDWIDEPILAAIKNGQDNWFSYNAENQEAQILTRAIFGQNVTQLRHNTRETLNALMKAAITEMDIDVSRVFKFI